MTIHSSLLSATEEDRLQPFISNHRQPGIIYVPSGTWEGGIVVDQHNLTLVGAGEETVIVGEEGRPAITVHAPNVRLINFSVRTEHERPAIAFTHGDAPQGVVQNVSILESGSHGIYRDNDWQSPVNAIIDCHFENIAGDGIFAESGSGPQNLVRGTTGEEIEGAFIRWGVNASFLLDNRCATSPIHFCSESGYNTIEGNEETEVIDEGNSNSHI